MEDDAAGEDDVREAFEAGFARDDVACVLMRCSDDAAQLS